MNAHHRSICTFSVKEPQKYQPIREALVEMAHNSLRLAQKPNVTSSNTTAQTLVPTIVERSSSRGSILTPPSASISHPISQQRTQGIPLDSLIMHRESSISRTPSTGFSISNQNFDEYNQAIQKCRLQSTVKLIIHGLHRRNSAGVFEDFNGTFEVPQDTVFSTLLDFLCAQSEFCNRL
jgi:hypothetical protein